jgi:predicted Zn-dependent peptidase
MYRKTVLDNGMTVISEEIGHVRSVSIGAWVQCGSRHEDRTFNGTAHFIEHMLFKGTKRRSAFDIASDIDSVGGVMNAFTGKELTSYYIKVPDYHLPLAIDLLADIYLNSLFDPEEMSKEKSVVLQEIHMVEDTPDEYVHDLFEKTFWSSHSLSLPVLGTKETVASFDRQSVMDFFHSRYGGDNLVLTAAGNLKHEELVKQAQNVFEHLERKCTMQPEPEPDVSSGVEFLEKDLEQLHMVIGTPAPSTLHQDRYAAILMNSVLGGSMSSRLFQEIREKRGLCYAIRSSVVSYRDAGLLSVYVGTTDDKISEVVLLIMDELRRLKIEPLTDKELRSAKELIKGNLLLSLESTDNRMSKLATNEIYFGRNISSEEIVGKIEAVTSDDIRRLACRLFTKDTLSVAVLGRMPEKDFHKDLLELS